MFDMIKPLPYAFKSFQTFQWFQLFKPQSLQSGVQKSTRKTLRPSCRDVPNVGKGVKGVSRKHHLGG